MFKFFSSRAQIRPKLSRRPRKKIFSRKSQKNHRIFTFFAILHIFTFKCTLKFPTLNRLNFCAKFYDFPKKGRTFFWPIFNLHESVWKTQKKIYVASRLNFKKTHKTTSTLVVLSFLGFLGPVMLRMCTKFLKMKKTRSVVVVLCGTHSWRCTEQIIMICLSKISCHGSASNAGVITKLWRGTWCACFLKKIL